jgi:hypothetical protein
MAGYRRPGPTGVGGLIDNIEDGTNAREVSTRPGPVGTGNRDQTHSDRSPTLESDPRKILERARPMRDRAARTGLVPDAVAALDHYLDRTGTFREIHPWKAESVRSWFEKAHVAQAKINFRLAGGIDTALAKAYDDAASGLATGTVPTSLSFTLSWKGLGGNTGIKGKLIDVYEAYRAVRTTLNDTLTYYGSTMKSRVRFLATSTPIAPRRFTVRVDQWQTWVLDNYEFEDKVFQILGIDLGKALEWPSQREMGLLAKTGLARGFPRSSRSWIITNHDFTPFVVDLGGFTPEQIKAMASLRRVKDAIQQDQERKKVANGNLPDPPPAEDALKGESDLYDMFTHLA